MKKCCFVIPFFGKLPNYFSLFLKTCEYNPDFNWLIVTDDKAEYCYPPNVERVYMSFDELRELIQSKFDFEISLEKPYKLCDFRPAYGFIFEEYLSDFRFWGYCDTDMLIGNINKFITDELLEKYDKFFCLGHMALFRNNADDRRLFMSKIKGKYWYKEAFTNPQNVIFDEDCRSSQNIHKIYLKRGKRVLEEDWSINFKILPARFIKITYVPDSKEFVADDQPAVYLWERGETCRYILENGKLQREDYLYIHLQERKMSIDESITSNDVIKVVPNKFLPLEVSKITEKNFSKIKKYTLNFHLIQYHYKWKKKRAKEILGI
ncbi:hypothetical protein KCL47_003063 [Clostridium perfringens]|nr:hypothetical protein [Clostridium perfringens]EHK2428491.1 hypothetical protein [Clostridium perfringens]